MRIGHQYTLAVVVRSVKLNIDVTYEYGVNNVVEDQQRQAVIQECSLKPL